MLLRNRNRGFCLQSIISLAAWRCFYIDFDANFQSTSIYFVPTRSSMWCGEIPAPLCNAVCAMGNISCRHKTNCTLSFVLGKSVRVTFLMRNVVLGEVNTFITKKLASRKTHTLLVCYGSNQYFLYMDAFILGTPPWLTGNLSLVCWHTCRKLSFEVLQTECGIFLWRCLRLKPLRRSCDCKMQEVHISPSFISGLLYWQTLPAENFYCCSATFSCYERQFSRHSKLHLLKDDRFCILTIHKSSNSIQVAYSEQQ